MGLLPYAATMEEEAGEAQRRLRAGGQVEVADVVEAMTVRIREQKEAIRRLIWACDGVKQSVLEVSDIKESED